MHVKYIRLRRKLEFYVYTIYQPHYRRTAQRRNLTGHAKRTLQKWYCINVDVDRP